jgi:multiple sugar transport system permease protein
MPEFLAYFRNSLVVASASTATGLTIAVLASYAVTRFSLPFKLDAIILSFLLFTRMIFPMALAIPFYRLSRMVGIHDTIYAVFLVQTGINIPFGVWMLRAAFLDFPISIEESAMIDGASIPVILVRIAIPMIKPAIAAAAIFMFMLSWNDYLFAVTLSSTPRAATIPVGLARFVQENIVRWEMMSAGATVFILPIFVVAYAVQNRLIRGFTAGTVKG